MSPFKLHQFPPLSNPLVSIVTRTKDRGILLKRAIKSVLEQTYTNIELIIVNDGGHAGDVDQIIMKHGDKRVRAIHHPKSLGMEAASNAGIQSAKGDLILIHDDDDTIAPTFLEKSVKFLIENPNYGGVICHTNLIFEDIKNETVTFKRRSEYNTWVENVDLDRMYAGNFFTPISFLYRKETHEKAGYYNEELPVVGDWEFYIRFLKEYDIGVIPELLANWHHRLKKKSNYSNSITGQMNLHKKYKSLIRNHYLREGLKGSPELEGLMIPQMESFVLLNERFARTSIIYWLRRVIQRIWEKLTW